MGGAAHEGRPTPKHGVDGRGALLRPGGEGHPVADHRKAAFVRLVRQPSGGPGFKLAPVGDRDDVAALLDGDASGQQAAGRVGGEVLGQRLAPAVSIDQGIDPSGRRSGPPPA